MASRGKISQKQSLALLGKLFTGLLTIDTQGATRTQELTAVRGKSNLVLRRKVAGGGQRGTVKHNAAIAILRGTVIRSFGGFIN